MSNDSLSNKLQVYDPTVDKWEEAKAMPAPENCISSQFY